LLINLFTEKIYLLLWFWFIGVFIVSLASLVRWAMFLLRGPRVQYLTLLMDVRDANSKHALTDFTTNYLCHDGFFAVKLIEENVSPVVTGDLLRALYEKFTGPSFSTSGRGSQSEDTAPLIRQKRANPSDGSHDSSGTLPPYGAGVYEPPRSYASLTKSTAPPYDKLTIDAEVLPPPPPLPPSAPLQLAES
jgi:hypothetical protein